MSPEAPDWREIRDRREMQPLGRIRLWFAMPDNTIVPATVNAAGLTEAMVERIGETLARERRPANPPIRYGDDGA